MVLYSFVGNTSTGLTLLCGAGAVLSFAFLIGFYGMAYHNYHNVLRGEDYTPVPKDEEVKWGPTNPNKAFERLQATRPSKERVATLEKLHKLRTEKAGDNERPQGPKVIRLGANSASTEPELWRELREDCVVAWDFIGLGLWFANVLVFWAYAAGDLVSNYPARNTTTCLTT